MKVKYQKNLHQKLTMLLPEMGRVRKIDSESGSETG